MCKKSKYDTNGKRQFRFSYTWAIGAIGAMLMLASISLFATEREEVVVRSSSVEKNVILVNIDKRGTALQLECFKSTTDCQIPKTGPYLIERLPPGKGAYTDCQNVDLYYRLTNSSAENKVGEYCLLGE